MTSVSAPQIHLSPHEAEAEAELRIVKLPTRLQYALLGFHGSLSQPWLDTRVADALEAVDAALQRSTKGRTRLLVWDALRSRECQQDIWRRYATVVRARWPGMPENEIVRRVMLYVSDPTGVFRHGTGGAVDVTLIRSGREAWLGTAFDDFSPRAAAAYFTEIPPVTEEDKEANRNRRLLSTAMGEAGFVVYPDEWWHWELGTAMWGTQQNGIPFLTRILVPPQATPSPARLSTTHRGMPSLVAGVAQPFSTCRERDNALAGEMLAHYYARTSTPSRSELERMLAAIC